MARALSLLFSHLNMSGFILNTAQMGKLRRTARHLRKESREETPCPWVLNSRSSLEHRLWWAEDCEAKVAILYKHTFLVCAHYSFGGVAPNPCVMVSVVESMALGG